MNRIVAVCVLLLITPSGLAHWLDHTHLPEWSRPGRVRWSLCYAEAKPEVLDLVAEARQNLLQGSYLEGSASAERAHALGIRGMTYVPLTWDYDNGKIFDRYPWLRGAEARKRDGSRYFEYHAGRFTGCYNQPDFRARRFAELDAFKKSAAIFFDTTSLVPCHCPLCRKLFRDFSRKNLGQELNLPDYDGVRRTSRQDRAFYRFRIESVMDYFVAIRERLNRNSPPSLICPNLHWSNAWHIELIARGLPDLVFFEQHGHPPFRKMFMGYKIAQAASHGKTAGQLIYLPPEVRAERGVLREDRSNAGLVEQAFHAPLLPQEILLAAAEAQACNGVYIPAYSIQPATPLLNRADPIVSECLAALKKHYEFAAKHERLFVGARPGSDVALLYPIRSQLWRPVPLHEDMKAVGNILAEAGIPFECIVDADLDAALLGACKVLIVPGATCLAAPHARAIRDFVEKGGMAVLSQQTGAFDENGDLSVLPPFPELRDLKEVAEISLGKGRILFSPSPLSELPGRQAAGLIRGFCRDVRCRLDTPLPTLFANVLEHKALGLVQIHLVNYNLRYTPLRLTVSDDDGTQEARTPFVHTKARAKKVLNIADPGKFGRPVLRFSGISCSDKGYELVIALNGADVAWFEAGDLRSGGWHDVPLPRLSLRKGKNEIVLRAEGRPNAHPDYFNLAVDRSSSKNRSFWSEDEGRTWSSEDLSRFDPGAQRGEYLIRICEWRDVALPWPAEQLLDSVKVIPAKDVAISLHKSELPSAGRAPLQCAVLSPDRAPARIEPEHVGDRIRIVLPVTEIYEVILVGSNTKFFEALCPSAR